MAYLEATSGRCPHDLPYLQGERSHRRLEEGGECFNFGPVLVLINAPRARV